MKSIRIAFMVLSPNKQNGNWKERRGNGLSGYLVFGERYGDIALALIIIGDTISIFALILRYKHGIKGKLTSKVDLTCAVPI